MARIELSDALYEPYEVKMKKTLSVLESDFNKIRAGRANPHVLDQITIPYYGTETPLNQVANIQVPEARMLLITPWDAAALKDIERAIHASDLGINPNNDGKCLRLVFPQLTEERRRDLSRDVNKLGEESKVAIRNIRREAIDKYRGHVKAKEMTDDEMRTFEDRVQQLTDNYVGKIDKAVAEKEKELMEI